MSPRYSKYSYLTYNLIRGLIWLVAILAFFLIAKYYFEDWYTGFMEDISDKPFLVFSTFSLSEILFGIIPPELFMIWALHQGGVVDYVMYTTILGAISYAAGLIGYFFGRAFSRFKIYAKLKGKSGAQMERKVKRFGGFMIFIAAVTPIPYSAICMVTGAARYRLTLFLLIALSRLLRFALYAYVIWHVDKI